MNTPLMHQSKPSFIARVSIIFLVLTLVYSVFYIIEKQAFIESFNVSNLSQVVVKRNADTERFLALTEEYYQTTKDIVMLEEKIARLRLMIQEKAMKQHSNSKHEGGSTHVQ